jgi:hypothetical protein
VICATDGHIVDIYGLFEATKNDARILSEVLANDNDLKTLLKPNDLFILDRGFRDCRKELKEMYKLDSQMPSLIQESTQKSQQAKASKQLDTIEANKTRLVTKVRWVVEVVNSFLKKSFKALSDVPNKTLVHTLVDYKIAAALINRFYNHLFSDPDDQALIAQNMLAKLNQANELKVMVEDLRLNRKSQFDALDACKIEDFPKLELQQIKTHITLGSYQLKQAIGYIGEHIKRGVYEVRVSKSIINVGQSKLLYSIIQSRHSNQVSYRVYVKYNPSISTIHSIESWYCTCKNGSRTVGCCSHVASVILFFSDTNFLEKFRNPAQNLVNVFPFFKNETSDDEEQEQAENETQKPKKDKKMKKKQAYSSTSSIEDELEQSFKRLLSVASENEFKKSRLESKQFDLDEFFAHVPEWGGLFVDENYNQTNISIIDTCTIDYMLFALWVSCKLNQTITESVKMFPDSTIASALSEIIYNIESKNWNVAKSLWLLKIANVLNPNSKQTISTFGSEYEHFIRYIVPFQRFELHIECSIGCINHNKTRLLTDLFFIKDNKKTQLSILQKSACAVCQCAKKETIKFLHDPPLLFIQTKVEDNICKSQLPLQLELSSQKFELLCATTHSSNHFKAIFFLFNSFYLIDDLKPNQNIQKIPRSKVISCVYYSK